MSLKLKAKLTSLMLCCALPLLAQQSFKYKAPIKPVDTDGFYRVELQPDLVAQCQRTLADIRLKDEQGTTVAYLLGNTLLEKERSNYRQFPEVISNTVSDTLISFIAENKDRLNISRLWLKLRNTAVSRNLNVLGSDDLTHWFAIKENIGLQNNDNRKAGTFDELLMLPVSTYRYIKIQVNGRNLTPVNILQVGVYVENTTPLQYVPVPLASIKTKNRADSTFINLSFKYAYAINKLHLELTGSKYYQRRLEIYQIDGNNREKVKDTLVSSAGNGDIYLSAKAFKLQLIIYNGDNQPLAVKVLQTSQAEQSLVAYLKKEHQYQLWFGNPKLNAPLYDLQFFADSINKVLPVVNHAAIVPLLNGQPKAKAQQLPAWLLWIAGGIGLLALFALTLKMTKEVTKNKP
jgi:hypothetical protein